jgi:hypothetical protein
VQHREQRIAVFFDLGALVAVARVVDGELVQAELLGHFVEFLVRRLEQRDPDEAVGPAHVLADVLGRDVGELAAVLVGDAADQHEVGPGSTRQAVPHDSRAEPRAATSASTRQTFLSNAT